MKILRLYYHKLQVLVTPEKILNEYNDIFLDLSDLPSCLFMMISIPIMKLLCCLPKNMLAQSYPG